MAFTSGFFSSSLGTVTVSTPFSIAALISSIFTFSGNLNLLTNFPLLLSIRCHSSFFSSCSLLLSPLICKILPSSTSTFTSSVRETSAFANARIDWKETPQAHVFKVDVPGIKKEEVKVEVEEGRILQISGERSKEQEEKNDEWHRMERSSGKFVRRFRLPENVKMEEIKAAMENGVLTVTVPKEEEKKPEVKAIDISA